MRTQHHASHWMPASCNAWTAWRCSRVGRWLAGVLDVDVLRWLAPLWSSQTTGVMHQETTSAASIGEHMRGWNDSSCVSLRPRKTSPSPYWLIALTPCTTANQRKHLWQPPWPLHSHTWHSNAKIGSLSGH